MESLTPKEQKIISQAWYKFFRDTDHFDTDNAHPRGWSWFWGLYDLYADPYDLEEFDIATIQTKLPDDHWLKKIDDDKLKDICYTIHTNETGEGMDFLDPVIGLLNAFRKVKQPCSIAIDFSSFDFDTYINFSNLIFLKKASFGRAKFSQDAIFDNALFLDEVSFDNATFSNDATFDKTLFYGKAFFTNANFFEEIKFDGAEFFKHTDFINTKFKKYAPSSHKADFHSNTSWSWEVDLWPSIGSHRNYQTGEAHKARITKNQSAYENLSSHMKKLDKYNDEHFFYRQEMRCRQWRASYPTKCFYWLYEFLSDYGYGLKQALWGWFLHIFLGAILIGITTKSVYNKSCDLAGNFYLDMVVSFANAHGVLFLKDGALKKCYMKFNDLPVFNIIWGFQAVFGILFLFLLLLTLRIRFRLK